MLRGINKAQKDNAHRLLQCLAVAIRPLRVEELAELLAFDFHASSSGGIPTLKEDWRWNDDEEAVLSTCSSLITIVRSDGSRVVQFSHFSVREYLTSPRLAQSHGDVSRFYIDLDAAHTIMVQACLGTLLQLDEHTGNRGGKGFPLAKYAAKHWTVHAQFQNVPLWVRAGIDDLFDASKPHFAAWLRVHNMDKMWYPFSPFTPYQKGSPLYYAALCGLYDLAERLIAKYPEQINAVGGHLVAPLPAALYKSHFRLANLLRRHGAIVDVQGDGGATPLHCASWTGLSDTMRWLLNHGADVNISRDDGRTPLHTTAAHRDLKTIELLLDHNADVNSRDNYGDTPLSLSISYPIVSQLEERVIDVVQRLLEHGADPNAGPDNSIPLHRSSFNGLLEVTRLLLSYGAKVDEKDNEGKTPFQIASAEGHHEIAKLLSEHVELVVPQL